MGSATNLTLEAPSALLWTTDSMCSAIAASRQAIAFSESERTYPNKLGLFVPILHCTMETFHVSHSETQVQLLKYNSSSGTASHDMSSKRQGAWLKHKGYNALSQVHKVISCATE